MRPCIGVMSGASRIINAKAVDGPNGGGGGKLPRARRGARSEEKKRKEETDRAIESVLRAENIKVAPQ